MAHPRKQRVNASDRLVSEIADGGMEVFILLQDDILPLEVFALLGDRKADFLLKASDLLIKSTKQTPVRKRPKCLCCATRIRKTYAAMVIAIPVHIHPTKSVGMFLCDTCGVGLDRSRLADKALIGLFAAWPGTQEIPRPTYPDGGRA